ncbi:hypothetical protein IFM89_015528 [Coptis chinensis]|uniref:SWIM-type domain-containing protein n=1 Tax=Coptis chinensis TaxID=261450 RepID=A0A835IWP7_9MAGN|nr:hypothetical protein IFM89_015528 [Coptis chinensis]
MQMWAKMEEDIRGWSHVFVELEGELIELVETMIVQTPQVTTPKCRKPTKNVKKMSTRRRSITKNKSSIKDNDDFYSKKCIGALDDSDGEDGWNEDLPPIAPLSSGPQVDILARQADILPPPPHTTNASTPHISGPSFISDSTTPISHAPTPFSPPPPPPPPPPRPIDEIKDDEGYKSTHSSEDEEDHVIANKVDFVDFIAGTDSIIDIDEGSEQSVNKPLIWEADCDMLNRMANANWVVKKIQDQMKVHFKTMTPVFIKEEVMRVFHVNISYWTAWNARFKSLQQIYGDYEESYNMIPVLCLILLRNLKLNKYKRKQACKEWDQNGLVPRVNKHISKMIEVCPHYTFEGSDDHLFVVKNYHGDRWAVNIVGHTCECRAWQMTGIVCVHAVRVLLPRRVEWVEYCISYFWVSEYKLAYTSNVKPMKDVKDWPKPDPTKHVKPPPLVRGIGRPRKERMRAKDENENGHVYKKKKMTCSKCKGEGHNARSCKGSLHRRIKQWKKIVRKTQSGIKKSKYKALRNGSDAPASDAPASDPIAEPPSNAPVRVAPPRHEYPRKSQSNGHTFFKAPEHRHTMGDLIMKQGEGQRNSVSVLHAAMGDLIMKQGEGKKKKKNSASVLHADHKENEYC